jgi:hypothetical protein
MVTVTVPVVAVLLAVRVSVLVVVVLVGLNDAVTPLGNPEADRLTLLVNPFCFVTVIVLVPFAPSRTVRLPGDAERVKLGEALTVRLTVVVCEIAPDTPVIVTVEVPAAAELLAVRVNVLVPVVLVGLNDAVTPLGNPDADRLTLPLNPFCGDTVIVLVPFPPGATVKLLGDAESAKFAVTVPERALIRFTPFGLPQPVTRSYPVTALKPLPLPADGGLLPLVMSWKSLV